MLAIVTLRNAGISAERWLRNKRWAPSPHMYRWVHCRYRNGNVVASVTAFGEGFFREWLCLSGFVVENLLDVCVLLLVQKTTSVRWCWCAGRFFGECTADAETETLRWVGADLFWGVCEWLCLSMLEVRAWGLSLGSVQLFWRFSPPLTFPPELFWPNRHKCGQRCSRSVVF